MEQIDYSHPALGDGCFGEGCLVAFGTDLVGDAYSGFNTPVPDDDPMDCAGHGTHVAGIVAAQKTAYNFTGAAPDAVLGAYRVFGCEGSAGNDVLIAAYNQAYEDGADIITASIGGPSGWSEDAWAVAVSRIVAEGVPCTVSAGNDGATGMFYASTAANGKDVMAIASFDNIYTPTLLTISTYAVDGGAEEQFGYTVGEPAAWSGVRLPLWSVSDDPTDPAAGCDALPADTPDLSGKVVVIRRGTCTFVQKAQNAADKGAKYILFYNNVDVGTSSVEVSAVPGIVAAGMVSSDVGKGWVAELKAGSEVVVDMATPDEGEGYIVYPKNAQSGGALSTYTSWGPTNEGDVKPQLGAPGGNILSTWPVAKGSYAVLSGTSMACPITAGIVALVSQVRGTLDPREIETVLSAYAKAAPFNDGGKFYDYLAPVPQQGAGIVQAHDAAHAKVLLEPSSLAFNDSDNAVASLNFTLTNGGKEAVDFAVSHVPTYSFYALDTDSVYALPFPSEPVAGHATLAFSETKISVAAGDSVTVEVLPTPPEGLAASRLPVWSGFVAVNGSDGTSLSLPYQGVGGSLRGATVLASDKDTWIARSTDADNAPVAANTTFVIPNPDGANATASTYPSFIVDLAMGSPLLHVEAVPASPASSSSSSEPLGAIQGSPFRWLPRGVNPLPWNGLLASGEAAPQGAYRLVARALHIFGDEGSEDEYDVGRSPAFRIRYA